MAGSVLNSTAVLRLNFCAKLNICASISRHFAKLQTVTSNAKRHPETTMIRIKLTLSILLLLIYNLVAVGQPRTNPKKIKTKGDYIHTPSKTAFPEKLSDYQLKSIYSFDKKDLNIGVTYDAESGNQKTTISIYIYPANDGSEGRLRNEYINSLQSIANHTRNGLNATQYPVRFTGEKYICNGYKAETKLQDKEFSQLILYECGTWFLKLRITSNQLDTSAISKLEEQIIKMFDPSRLTSIKPLNLKADIYYAKAAFRDSTLLGSTMGSALKKIEWAAENIEEDERASGFPDLYLYMHIASLMEFVKFDKERNFSRSESTQLYLDELNSIIDSGFIAEFIMEQFGMIMIVPENVIFDFDGFDEWKQSNKITIDLNKRFYLIAYGQK